MILDPRTPLLTQAEAAAASGLAMKTIDNYIQHGFVIPARLERRRVFSARQIARLTLVEQLNTGWQIPPAAAFNAADRLLALPLCRTVLSRAAEVPIDAAWVAAVHGEERVRLMRGEDGRFDLVQQGENEEASFIRMEIAPHGFLRAVLWRCAAVVRDREIALPPTC